MNSFRKYIAELTGTAVLVLAVLAFKLFREKRTSSNRG